MCSLKGSEEGSTGASGESLEGQEHLRDPRGRGGVQEVEGKAREEKVGSSSPPMCSHNHPTSVLILSNFRPEIQVNSNATRGQAGVTNE